MRRKNTAPPCLRMKRTSVFAAPWFFVTALLLLSHNNASTFCHAFPSFQEEIPNGGHVPNPDGGVWSGVGHQDPSGGGPLNPFGLDFENAGFEWTVELCRMDSDGDGRSNGKELGDPDCVWEIGLAPAFPASSHPGIPEPKEGQNAPVDVDPCEHFTPPSDTITLDVAFSQPNYLDGTKRTNYICEQRTLQSPTTDQEFHQIRYGMLPHNRKILHHIEIYICDEGHSSDGNKVDQGPYECSGIEGKCELLAGWALGGDDFCEPPNVGSYVGFRRQGMVFKIEAHYDNAMLLPEQDQTGMRLYLTPTLRTFESGLLTVGSDYYGRQFVIPAGEPNYELTNICPTTATQQLRRPIWVYSWNPHMHHHGKSLVTEHYRCGKKIGELGHIDAFEFDNQQSYAFDVPIKILPGDALVTTCTYDTSKIVDGPVLGGEGSDDEMCENYLTYYPFAGSDSKPNFFTACMSYPDGWNPDLADGYDDHTPFVALDLGGDDLIWDFDPDPANNVASCCNTNDNGKTCENMYLSGPDGPCAIYSDCRGEGAECRGGLCFNATSEDFSISTELVSHFGALAGIIALLFILGYIVCQRRRVMA